MSDNHAKARAERLRAALRENLKRRKVQARGREAAEPEQAEEPPSPDRGGGRKE